MRIAVGLSGGVDSAAAASILLEAGHKVTGVYFIMHDSHLAGIPKARAAAADLGIELAEADLRERFSRDVESPFVSGYLSGRTPNPCVVCNERIKFPALAEFADSIGADMIATGHYAGIERNGDVFSVRRGGDPRKDQSYFLYRLGSGLLSRTVFPLADMTKTETRKYAASRGISAASRKDSQDVCFIPEGGAGDYVSRFAGGETPDGDFTDLSGKVLGRHRGIWNYTVGQRRGLGIASDAPLYVVRLVPDENRIVLGRESDLYCDTVRIADCRFNPVPGDDASPFGDVCIRYSKKTARAEIIPHGNGYLLKFDTPQRAPAPGQSAVIYRGDRVLGGGIITRRADSSET